MFIWRRADFRQIVVLTALISLPIRLRAVLEQRHASFGFFFEAMTAR